MSIVQLATIGLKISLIAIVLALGMATTRRDVTLLVRKPRLLLRSLISMQLLAPLYALALVTALPIGAAAKIALVTLAVSPVPPILPKRELRVGGEKSYVVSLLATSAILSVIVIPVTLLLLGRWFGLSLAIAPASIAKVVAATVLLPLGVGMGFHAMAPTLSAATSRLVGIIGSALLVFSVVPVFIATLPAFRELVGGGTLVIVAAYSVGALLIGHLLGGPDRENRTVLAQSTATRHPGIAIALINANFAAQPLAVPAVLLLVIVSAIVTTPYVMAHRHRRAASARGELPPHDHIPV